MERRYETTVEPASTRLWDPKVRRALKALGIDTPEVTA